MSAKQVLRDHINAMHKGMPAHYRTYEAMGAWHRLQHHRFSVNHYHEGPNTGPGDRPPGWWTGEGAVSR